MTRSKQLNTAQANKKDEFYTQLVDIEAEMNYHEKEFYDKTVLCNCDDPLSSNFSIYFKRNFKRLHLKELICTCFNSQYNDFLNLSESRGLGMIYNGTKKSGEVFLLCGNGDFRSEECIEYLKKADIIVTNPPFSLFREYVALLDKYDKKFLIIGNVNAISYKECFSLIVANKMRLGCSIHAGDREFRVPDDYPLNASGCRTDDNGNKFIRVKGVRWFTNLECNNYESLLLTKEYNPLYYNKFDNIDAINVEKTKDIPMNYNGIMGVPITFLDKYNPSQFEIIGNEYTLNIPGGRGYIKGIRKYSRIFIKHKNLQYGKV